MTSCTQCPASTPFSGPGTANETACVSCDAGLFWNNATHECSQCPANVSSATYRCIGSDTRIDALNHTTGCTSSSSSPLPSPIIIINFLSDQSYSNAAGSSTCTNCPADKPFAAPNSTSIADCVACDSDDHFWNGNLCLLKDECTSLSIQSVDLAVQTHISVATSRAMYNSMCNMRYVNGSSVLGYSYSQFKWTSGSPSRISSDSGDLRCAYTTSNCRCPQSASSSIDALPSDLELVISGEDPEAWVLPPSSLAESSKLSLNEGTCGSTSTCVPYPLDRHLLRTPCYHWLGRVKGSITYFDRSRSETATIADYTYPKGFGIMTTGKIILLP